MHPSFFMLFRPIHHTFAPLADREQILLAMRGILSPWQLQNGDATRRLKLALQGIWKTDAFLFSTGREALLALLQSLQCPPGAEVIVQGFTCTVVVNAIRAAGGVPVFADIERSTLNADPEEVRQRITNKTCAVICQHTFGIPGPTAELRALCTTRGLMLIEDCAHIHPDEQGPGDIGNAADAVLLSFGRDKALSGVSGGAILCRDPDLTLRLAEREAAATVLPAHLTIRLLLYPLLYGIAKPLYGCGVGKALLVIARALKLLPSILTQEEKLGRQPQTLHCLPSALAALALAQLRKLPELNSQRRALTRFYLEQCAHYGWPVLHGIRNDLPLQKFPLFVTDAEGIRRALKKQNIHLHDGWTGCVICPSSADSSACGYRSGEDPHAEAAAEAILSLPTHPTMTLEDAGQLVRALAELPQMNKH